MGSGPPPPPDYTAAAEATAKSSAETTNMQTWANRANQTNPWGSQSWTTQAVTDPATGQQVTQWNQNTTLDPKLQHALDSQINLQSGRSDLANSLFPRAQQEFGNAMDWSQLTPWASTPQGQQLSATTNPYGFGPQQQNINTSAQRGQPLQRSLDYSGLQGVDQADQTRQNAYDSIYQQGASRLDPQWQQQQTQMETQLANQGITPGSSAYTQAMDNMQRQKTDAYNQLQMSATQGAGQQAQVDYGINMGLRQQQANEATQQGQFGNQAAQTAFGFGNQSRAQQLAAQQAAFGQSLQGSNYGLQQQQQAFGQNQAAGAQNYSQALQSSQFQNQLRNQQLTEAMQQRGFSLNEINAIISGQQVNSPQFSGYNQAQASQATDYSGAAKDQYSASMDAYNAKQAQMGQIMGAVGGVAGAAMTGGSSSLMGMAFSDRRLKRDIRRVGTHPRGFGLYTYRFVGERGRRAGVIAQDVQRFAPELVRSFRGVLMVDHSRLQEVTS